MRARNIKKEFWENEEVADCDPVSRLLFIGLWCYADREGLFEWRPKRIKALIFPYDGFKIDKYLEELANAELILKYSVKGKEYGSVLNFKKHQKPHPHEAKSRIPYPSKADPEEVEKKEGENPELNQCDDMSLQCNDNDTPRFANVSECQSDIRKEERGYSDVRNDDIRNDDILITSKMTFEDWWSLYPKKKEKKKALAAWKKLKPDSVLIDTMIYSLEAHKASYDWIKEGGKYIPYPERWIKNCRWEDEIDTDIKKLPCSDVTLRTMNNLRGFLNEE